MCYRQFLDMRALLGPQLAEAQLTVAAFMVKQSDDAARLLAVRCGRQLWCDCLPHAPHVHLHVPALDQRVPSLPHAEPAEFGSTALSWCCCDLAGVLRRPGGRVAWPGGEHEGKEKGDGLQRKGCGKASLVEWGGGSFPLP